MIDLRSSRIVASFAAAVMTACSAPVAPPIADRPLPVRLAGEPGLDGRDPAEILDATVRGDLLALNVRHSGGCTEHEFGLAHSGIFLESLPVQTNLSLAHDAHRDPCRAVVERSLAFDLRPLRELYERLYGEGGVITLHVHAPGGDQTVSVRYGL